MRKVILHYHIFKNAGVTIDSIFQRQFGTIGRIEGDRFEGTLHPSLLLQYVLDNPLIKAVSTHQGRFPVPTSDEIKFLPVVFLRHPIDRVGSVYSFERSQPDTVVSPAVVIARESSFPDYVKWRLEKNHGAVIKNFQTIFLSGREKDMRSATATRNDLEIAINRISQLNFFGIVEFFDKSIQKMEKYLIHDFENFSCSYVILNRSIDRKNSLEERLNVIKSELGPILYDQLLNINALDIQLYDHAVKLFAERNQESHDFS